MKMVDEQNMASELGSIGLCEDNEYKESLLLEQGNITESFHKDGA